MAASNSEDDNEYSEFEDEDDDDYDEAKDEQLQKSNAGLQNIPEIDLVPNSESDNELEEDEYTEEEEGTFVRPEVLLARMKKESILEIDNKSLRGNKIKSLALSKILHGECHWKVAESHLDLANIYLKGKYFPLQALKHAELARNILLTAQSSNLNMQYLLQDLYYVMGRANFQLNKYKESENCLRKAKLVSDNSNNATEKYKKLKVNTLASLATTLGKLGQFGQAAECVEEGLEEVGKMSGDGSKILHIRLYKQIINLELSNGKHANIAAAEDAVKKAITLSEETNGQNCSDTAELYVLYSKIGTQHEIVDHLKIEENLQEALRIYQAVDNTEKIFSTQQMLCKVLMQQEKFREARELLDKCIEECEFLKGDTSLLSAEFYELMGSCMFAQNKISTALVYLQRAEEIYRGKQKYAKKQEKILKVIDVIRKTSKDDKMKTSADKMKERPRFF